MQENIESSFCSAAIESSAHLLLHCNLASAVWYKVCRWLGIFLVYPPNLFISFASFLGFAGSKKKEKRFVFDLARGDLGDLEGAKRFDFQ
jgi:hypothetical protein